MNLLEAYLDDALSPSQVERVDRRLAAEPELAAALAGLRQDRMLRIAAIETLMPTETEGADFAEKMLGSVRQRERERKLRRWSRVFVGIAACIVIGFAMGRIGMGGHDESLPPRAAAPTIVNADTHLVGDTPPAIHPGPADQGPYQVEVLDDTGKVIAIQHFMRLEDARAFADDLNKFQLRRQQVQDGQAKLVSDHF